MCGLGKHHVQKFEEKCTVLRKMLPKWHEKSLLISRSTFKDDVVLPSLLRADRNWRVESSHMDLIVITVWLTRPITAALSLFLWLFTNHTTTHSDSAECIFVLGMYSLLCGVLSPRLLVPPPSCCTVHVTLSGLCTWVVRLGPFTFRHLKQYNGRRSWAVDHVTSTKNTWFLCLNYFF